MLRNMWKNHDPSLRLIAPLAILAVIVIGMLNVSILAIGARADRQSARWEESLIGSGLTSRIETRLVAEVETLARMDPLQLVMPQDATMVTTFGADGSRLASRVRAGAAREQPSDFVRLARPALVDLTGAKGLGESDIPVGFAIGWSAGRPVLTVAVHSLSPAARAQGLTVVATIDLTNFIRDYADSKHLTDYRLVLLDHPRHGASIVPLVIPSMTPVVGFEWQPRRIGAETIALALPIIWGVTLLMLTAGVLLTRRTLRLAQSLVASEAHAQHLALHDPMTGLGNRALFTDRLEHAVELRRRNGGMLAVACIDLDRFKHVNDTLGHQAGDAMIKEAAGRITGLTRASDTVARLGGDEFALILYPVTDRAGLESLCARLTEALSARLDLPNGQAALSASIGVTIMTDDMDGADAIRQADLALYRAKREGRGRFELFEPEMDESLKLRHEIENDLRGALRDGALKVHYQPQYTARGELEGVEALVRWNHPSRGLIGPAYFIPIAEEAGMIDELGLFVMSEAMSAAARWPTLKMAINVSPLQLQRPGFVARCCELAKEHGVDPSRIELEITEGVLLENEPRIQESLRALRAAGFKLALDDFGTGYSSLSYLNIYPVDKIKIDRSFVSNLGLDGDAEKVVRAIIRLGRALGLSVTAEGVETEAQRSKLVAAGCHSLQGFLHGHPGEAAVIDELLVLQAKARAA